MTSTVLAVSAAYVVMGVLLLAVGLTSRFAWWIKAVAIVIASAFFIEVFFATQGLLGWPGAGRLPQKFQLLWVRVVEPDRLAGSRGAIYLWIEEVDDNNVPDGVPRAFRLPYSRPLADRSALARDEIMRGKPQQGTVQELQDEEAKQDPNSDEMKTGSRTEGGITTADLEQAQLLQQAQRVEFHPMQGPILPPKGP
jgi:hypothetical protein